MQMYAFFSELSDKVRCMWEKNSTFVLMYYYASAFEYCYNILNYWLL